MWKKCKKTLNILRQQMMHCDFLTIQKSRNMHSWSKDIESYIEQKKEIYFTWLQTKDLWNRQKLKQHIDKASSIKLK